MNLYVKQFLFRGLIFGGFGPIILGIVYFIHSLVMPEALLSGGEVCLGTVSVYLLAFVQAGTTVFPQIEHWSTAKSLFFHFFTLYAVYVGCYLINTWIPFRWAVLLIFTAVFAAVFLGIWFSVWLAVRSVSRRMNEKLKS